MSGKKDEGLRALLEDARSLPREIEPGRDLWPDIERRIGEQRIVRGRFRPAGRGWLAVAAAALLFAAALATGVLREPETHPAGEMDLEYAMASREVLDRLDGGELDAETVALIRRNLDIIDDAVREIRGALDQDPSNVGLNQLLTAEVLRRGALLRQAAVLSEPI